MAFRIFKVSLNIDLQTATNPKPIFVEGSRTRPEFGSAWEHLEHLGTFGDSCGHLGHFGSIWRHLGTSESNWQHLGAAGVEHPGTLKNYAKEPLTSTRLDLGLVEGVCRSTFSDKLKDGRAQKLRTYIIQKTLED